MNTPTPGDLIARLLADAITYHRQQANGTPDQFGNRPTKPNVELEAWHTNVADMLAALSALPAAGGEQCPFCLRDGKHPRYEECPALNAPTTFTLTETTTPQPSAAEDGGSPESAMQKVIDRVVDGVMGQREEVLRAFVAKYGFQPDEAVQVSGPDGSWRIIRRSDMHANPDAAVGAQRDGKELARMHADYTVDERGRESWDFDAHGLANFVRDLTAAPAAGKGVDGVSLADIHLAAQMLTWGRDEGLTEKQEAEVDAHAQKLFAALTRQPETCQCAECRRNIALARAGSPFIMDPLPERDPSRANAEQGLYRKYDVRRTDGSDAPGGKHHGCEYFVLDVKHDPLARAALAGYADAAESTHPQLAADLRERYTLTRQPQPTPEPAMTDLPPLHARLYESTPEEIAEALRYLAMADAVAVALTRQPVAGDGWRPIESAPKDGSQFLVWTNRLGFAVVTHAVDDPMPQDIVPSGHHLRVDDGKFGPYPIRGDYPTRWQPLPAAPAATPTDGEAASAETRC